MTCEKPYILCRGNPEDKVIRLYFNKPLSNSIGNNPKLYFVFRKDKGIIISSKPIEDTTSFFVYDLKTETVTYSAALAKAIIALPNCPKADFKLYGWEKCNEGVELMLEKANFEEVI